VLNNGETDVDCGGPNCGDCADGKICANNGDCSSGFCNPMTLVCAAPTCMDTFKNGNETDVDCGGPDCADCADGKTCTAGSDCVSAYCNPMNVCSVPSCMDTFKNGNETDVDCGGADCPDCAVGKACAADGDCASAMCYENVCVAAVNGCDVATAQDLTGGAPVTVLFPAGGLTYNPRCIKVSVNTVVTFTADGGSSFVAHPLIGGLVVGMTKTPAASGPFVPITNSGMSKPFTMSAAGTYPYYCNPHATLGMNGAVFVVP
jgi:plastocyanin